MKSSLGMGSDGECKPWTTRGDWFLKRPKGVNGLSGYIWFPAAKAA